MGVQNCVYVVALVHGGHQFVCRRNRSVQHPMVIKVGMAKGPLKNYLHEFEMQGFSTHLLAVIMHANHWCMSRIKKLLRTRRFRCGLVAKETNKFRKMKDTYIPDLRTINLIRRFAQGCVLDFGDWLHMDPLDSVALRYHGPEVSALEADDQLTRADVIALRGGWLSKREQTLVAQLSWQWGA